MLYAHLDLSSSARMQYRVDEALCSQQARQSSPGLPPNETITQCTLATDLLEVRARAMADIGIARLYKEAPQVRAGCVVNHTHWKLGK